MALLVHTDNLYYSKLVYTGMTGTHYFPTVFGLDSIYGMLIFISLLCSNLSRR